MVWTQWQSENLSRKTEHFLRGNLHIFLQTSQTNKLLSLYFYRELYSFIMSYFPFLFLTKMCKLMDINFLDDIINNTLQQYMYK